MVESRTLGYQSVFEIITTWGNMYHSFEEYSHIVRYGNPCENLRGEMYPSLLRISFSPPLPFLFVIKVVIIPLKFHRGMYSRPFSMICILVHDDN